MSEHLCDRDYFHGPHDFTRGGVDLECPGDLRARRTAAELVAEKPVLADVGTVPLVNGLAVMSA